MVTRNDLTNYVEQLLSDAVGTFYEKPYQNILSALRFNDLRAAQCIADNLISGADEDRAWDQQISTLIFALDGTLDHYGLTL